jgi:hypothetical protein
MQCTPALAKQALLAKLAVAYDSYIKCRAALSPAGNGGALLSNLLN